MKLESEVQNSIMTRYFYYQLINVYVTVGFSGNNLWSQLITILERPQTFIDVVGGTHTIHTTDVKYAALICIPSRKTSRRFSFLLQFAYRKNLCGYSFGDDSTLATVHYSPYGFLYGQKDHNSKGPKNCTFFVFYVLENNYLLMIHVY